MKKYNTLFTHLIFWIGYVTIIILVYGYGHDDLLNTCIDTVGSHLISAAIFYATALFIFPHFFNRREYLLFIVSLFMTLILSVSIRYLIPFYVYPSLFGKTMAMISGNNEMLIRKFCFQWFTFSLYGFFYWRSTVDKNKARSEKLELENAALRAQINPHFTMNSLDIFRIQTLESDPQVSEGIFWFMKILKAGITTPEEDGKIKFKIEMEAIEGTIYMFKLRFPELQLEEILEVQHKDDIRIVPHIVFPFVENAFKHGLYTDEANKIQIKLFATPDQVRITVKNKKDSRIKDNSTGIGLQYVKRHLESGYKGKYDLIINDSEDLYTVDLSVKLN